MAADRIAVIGLGYVGLPVACALAAAGFDVLGFDIDPSRIGEIQTGYDRTAEVPDTELKASTLHVSVDPESLKSRDTFIITVPTPLNSALQPDLGPLLAATDTVARALSTGALVIYESTVFPGATEEECLPRLEGISGLRAGTDFGLAYSPERINPGDPDHRLANIAKIVSATTAAALERTADLYAHIIRAPIHRVASVRVAEAAKVIENAQRDLNIAFVNELARICDRLGLDTRDVLAAAGTKWNFIPFEPGLVGGHCIGIDPVYLAHRAKRAGYDPEVIVAARRINDGMPEFIARRCIEMLQRSQSRSWRVTLLGLTFKENVPDLRNSAAVVLARELTAHGLELQLADPLANPDEVIRVFGTPLTPIGELTPGGATILLVAHASFLDRGWDLIRRTLPQDGGGIVIDVKGRLCRVEQPEGVRLWRL